MARQIIDPRFAREKDISIIWEGHFAGSTIPSCQIEEWANLTCALLRTGASTAAYLSLGTSFLKAKLAPKK